MDPETLDAAPPGAGAEMRESLAANLRPETFDAAANTVDVVFYTGAEVERYDWYREEAYTLTIDVAGMDLSRLNGGAGVFLDHWSTVDPNRHVGVVERAWLEGGVAKATIRFARDGLGPQIAARVRDGIVRNVSMGVAFKERTRERGEDGKLRVTVTRSEPYEISFVGVPADARAQTLSHDSGARPDRAAVDPGRATETGMDPEIENGAAPAAQTAAAAAPDAAALLAAERARLAGIDRAIDAFAHAGVVVSAEDKQGWINSGASLEAVRDVLQERLASAAAETRIRPQTRAAVVETRGPQRAALAAQAMAHRWFGGELAADARDFRGMTLVQLAAEALSWQGVSPRGMTADEIAREALAHSTSDFPLILSSIVERSLLPAYRAVPVVYPRIAARRNFTNFKPHYMLRLGDMPDTQEIPENGTIPMGTFGEERESVSLKERGRRIAVTRRMIVNDDLGAFTQVPQALGSRLRFLEEKLVMGVLNANPTMSDNVALFHATHKNLAGAGAAPSSTTFEAMRLAMASQTGVGSTAKGEEPDYIGVIPTIVLTGPKGQQKAEQAVAPIVAAEEGKVNTWVGKIEVLTSVFLQVASGAEPWFGFGDPMVYPAIVYGYLEGREGPIVETRQGWENTGTEIRILHDFGAGAIDYRTVYRNPGA